MSKLKELQIHVMPTFSFGTKEECERLLKETMLGVDKTITAFEFLPEYYQIVDYLTDTKGQGLFLVGSVGRGKSIIAEKVLKVLFFGRFKKVVNVFHAQDLGKKLDEVRNKKFIVIDDVGTESPHNEYGVKSEAFADLIAYAERKAAVVFITTNLTSEELIERYGERIIDRIQKLCRIVKLEGKSLRKKNEHKSMS